MRSMRPILLVASLLAASSCARAESPSRGELLYNTHCVGCHSTQMHWRERRLARDWGTLKAQVRRFQEAAYLRWSDEDIDAVAHYLNDTIYRFPEAQSRR